MKPKKRNLKKYTKKMTHSLYNDILLQELKKYKDKKILVAFSGGKDSLMLLDFINNQRESLNIYAGACHINHGLRHTAKRDEDFCRLYCQKKYIDFYVYDISEELKNDNSCGTEASARKYRYKYLLQTVKENDYDFLFTAHTYSDDIESFFVDLYTGASLFTLGGIMYENNQIIRPMLNITTEMVNDYIYKNNLEPVLDETNNDIKYVRNRIRHKLIPVLYGCGNEFEKSVIKLQKESNRLNEYLYKKVKHVILKQDNIIILKRYSFMELEDIEKEYLLGKVFSLFFRVSKSILYEALSFLNNNNSKRLDLPNGYVIEQSYNSIKIFKKILICNFFYNKPAGIFLIKTNDFQIEFLNELKDKTLIIRNRNRGDKLGRKKLKDLFIDKQIELFERDRAVIIEDDNIIIWSEYISNNNNIIFKRYGI